MDLSSILHLADLHHYKLHVARSNGKDEPLDVFLRDRTEWHKWNSWQGSRNEFNRGFILSIIQFYPEPNTWLFGGIYAVENRLPEKNTFSYKVNLLEQGQELIGRLKLTGSFTRGRAFKLETSYNDLTVSEILKQPYTGEVFGGYENVSLDFSMLEIIYLHSRIDWQTALSNIKGVYLIADKKTGKKYVGSAYGATGIWSRWGDYIRTGHGWNDELVGLSNLDASYASTNFRMTLLECWPFKTDDKVIFQRESFWKEALLTRTHGYNNN